MEGSEMGVGVSEGENYKGRRRLSDEWLVTKMPFPGFEMTNV